HRATQTPTASSDWSIAHTASHHSARRCISCGINPRRESGVLSLSHLDRPFTPNYDGVQPVQSRIGSPLAHGPPPYETRFPAGESVCYSSFFPVALTGAPMTALHEPHLNNGNE